MEEHLVVAVHGLWGNPNHLWYVKKALLEQFPDINLLVTTSNAGNRTYDGVDVCGERAANEVKEYIKQSEKEGKTIKKISFVGYSLGGLTARYAIGILYAAGLFDEIEPINFTTFATPHLGVSPTSTGFWATAVASIGSRTLSASGTHLFLADSVQGRPLLEVMSDTEGPYVKGLSKFRKRVVYANIANDRSVPYFTAAIVSTDPFRDLSKVTLNYDTDFPILLDPEKHIAAKQPSNDQVAYTMSPRELAFRYTMFGLLPVFFTVYCVSSIFNTFKSNRRILAHREEFADDGAPELNSFTEELAEDMMELGEKEEGTLTLSKAQLSIVRKLNTLEWEKYPVHIRKTMHSHAAIVSRSDADRYSEGHQVMDHWLTRVFET